jgi:predicted kinase
MANAHLVVVSGLSGTGKSAIARRLAADLGLPCVGTDQLKEVLFDTLGWSDVTWSDRLRNAASALIWSVCRSMLEARQSVVIEGAFKTELDGPRLRAMREQFRPRIVEVHCHAPREVLAERVAKRAESGERHPGHGDQDQEALREEVIPELLTDPDPLLDAPHAYILHNTEEELTDARYADLLARVRAFVESA